MVLKIIACLLILVGILMVGIAAKTLCGDWTHLKAEEILFSQIWVYVGTACIVSGLGVGYWYWSRPE